MLTISRFFLNLTQTLKTFMEQFKVCLKENVAIREAEEKAQRAREAKEAREREKQEAKEALEKKTNPVGGSGGGDADQKGVVDELLSQLNSGDVFKQRERKKRPPKPGGDYNRARGGGASEINVADASVALAAKNVASRSSASLNVVTEKAASRSGLPKTGYRGERFEGRERM